ncbi:hypothetical protein AB0M87_04770 [Streptomyces sp. NPDC051320]|uniref:hypothetical protein n=1 Tax=Streptomyces sp. NPDC051320 TaxID=3154644 RepID=UPI003441E250
MTIDDFVMLGKTVPEPQSDGRTFVCSAGVSSTLRELIRVYPLGRYGAPRRWSVSQVPLERNPKDSRRESFKVAGDRSPGAHDHINDAFTTVRPEYPKAGRIELLAPYEVASIKEANARKMSLAVIHPEHLDINFDHNPESPDSPQLALFDSGKPEPQGAKRFAYIPRIHFRDSERENHLMLRDWGCFEFMRKYGDGRRGELPDALHMTPSSSLLVGNFNRHRSSWLVISVLNGLREAPGLFGLSDAA